MVAPLAASVRSPLMIICATFGVYRWLMSEAPVVSVSRERDGVALIHLNRPPANSYDRGFLDALNVAVDEVRWDGAIGGAVLVSDLAPRFFSAGADITNFQRSSQAERVMTVLHAHEILLKIERTPKIFVAALSGHALGGGLEIALACDFRFAAEGEYRIGVPEVSLGLLPGNGGTQRLTRLVGRTRALDLLLSGTPVNPARALELGIVDRLVAADALLDEAVSYVGKLAAGPALAVGNIKIAAKLGADLPLEGALALEREAVWRLFMSQDAAEGMAAFAEKRPPHWQGR
jgi:enoyl-CoA hydratase/carnithine racemase